MQNTKIVLLLVALALVAVAIAGVSYAQAMSFRNQAPQQTYSGNSVPSYGNGYYPAPQQGSAYPYKMGMGMGMMRGYW